MAEALDAYYMYGCYSFTPLNILKISEFQLDCIIFQKVADLTPILTNIYIAGLEDLLKEKCQYDKKLIWPIEFKKFIGNGFEFEKDSYKHFEYWVSEIAKENKYL